MSTPTPVHAARPSSASYRVPKGRIAIVAGFVLASAVAGFGLGYAATHTTSRSAVVAPDVTPRVGEFRLAPGLQQPPGIAVPNVRPMASPVPGDFRLAPGNLPPEGLDGS